MGDRAQFEDLMGELQNLLIQMTESRIMADYTREAALMEQALELDDIHVLLGKSMDLIGAEDRDEQLARALRLSGLLKRMRETAS
jgi:hypothetical protein